MFEFERQPGTGYYSWIQQQRKHSKNAERPGLLFFHGKALLSFDSNASKVIRKTHRKQLFLETDDSDLSIKYVYKKAAELLGVEEDILKEQIKSNFQSLFNKKL